MKQVLLIIIGIAIAGLATLFAIENASVVSLSIFEFRSAQLPLFVWLVIAFSAGLVLGLFVAAIVFSGRKLVNGKLNKISVPTVRNRLSCRKSQG